VWKFGRMWSNIFGLEKTNQNLTSIILKTWLPYVSFCWSWVNEILLNFTDGSSQFPGSQSLPICDRIHRLFYSPTSIGTVDRWGDCAEEHHVLRFQTKMFLTFPVITPCVNWKFWNVPGLCLLLPNRCMERKGNELFLSQFLHAIETEQEKGFIFSSFPYSLTFTEMEMRKSGGDFSS